MCVCCNRYRYTSLGLVHLLKKKYIEEKRELKTHKGIRTRKKGIIYIYKSIPKKPKKEEEKSK